MEEGIISRKLFLHVVLSSLFIVSLLAFVIVPGPARPVEAASGPQPVTPMVAAGFRHTVALKSDGTVVAVGDNGWGQCNVSSWTGIQQVAAGSEHTVGLKSDGTVVAVGDDYYSDCNVGSWTGIQQVAAGGEYTVGLKSDGTVVAVGRNCCGQCDVSSWTGIQQVAAGDEYTVGLKSDGTVVAVGRNWCGQCNVSSWSGIQQVAAGYEHTVGLKSDGTVVAAGDNTYSQCDVSSWSGIQQVAAGCEYTVGLKSDGTVVAVGYNYDGECNVGNWSDIVQVSAGYYHTVGLKSDGTVVAVGDNSYGQCNTSGWNLGSTSANITLTSPIGGERWAIGSTQSIKWTSSGVTGNVSIYLSRDAGTTWDTIFSGTPNDGNQDWVVTGPSTALARVKISSVNDPKIVDVTSYNFLILTIPGLQITDFKQYSIPWGNKPYGDPNRPNVLASDTISKWGCFLTCWAMILDYYGHLPGYNVHTNPDVLNDWLRLPENRGYCGNNKDGTYNGKFVDSNKVIKYGQTVMGLPLFPVVNQGNDSAKLNSLLEAGIPVILGVRDKNDGYGPHHYVLAVGETTSLTGQPTWYINDPAYPLNTTLDEQYGNLFTTMTYTDSPAGPHSFFGAIMLMLKSPAELLVTDPQGRRTGVDPRTNTIYNEIPEASYVTLGLAPEDDGEPIHPLKVFDSPTPIDGHYSIQVIGTGNGSYTLDSLSYDDLGNSNSTSVSRSVAVDSVDTYEMDYSSGESTSVTGTTREVNGNILPGVSITLDGIGPVLSDQNGQFQIMATATGNYTVTAHKDGFRDRTQTISIAGLGSGYAVTCNFQGQSGLTTVTPPPQQPTATSPADGAAGTSLTPILESSAFFSADEEATHAASRWQITTTPGDYSNTVFDSDIDNINKTSITIPSGKLSYNTTYYWHVRYQDNYGTWSDYSAEFSFTTESLVTADFSVAPVQAVLPGQTVTFTDTSTGDATSWVWDFGDETTAVWNTTTRPGDGKVTHSYSTTGNYTVSLKVSGPAGEDTKTKPILIRVPTPTPPSGGGLPWLYIIIGIVVVLAIGGGIFWYLRRRG